jgi:hypothetical protein
MVDIPRSSFIPKEGTGLTPGRVRRTRTFHIFGFIATISLVGSLLSAGFVYFLKSSADSNLASAKQALIDQKNLFNPESIAEVREFDRRLQAAGLLIKNHISPLKIFAALEERTKQRIQFTSFTLEHTPAFEVIVSLDGTTPEFKTLALQESSFADDTLLKDVLFSQVSTSDSTEGGGSASQSITFSLKGSLDTSRLLYDGTVPPSVSDTAFLQVEEALIAVDPSLTDSAVLGESITRHPL